MPTCLRLFILTVYNRSGGQRRFVIDFFNIWGLSDFIRIVFLLAVKVVQIGNALVDTWLHPDEALSPV